MMIRLLLLSCFCSQAFSFFSRDKLVKTGRNTILDFELGSDIVAIDFDTKDCLFEKCSCKHDENCECGVTGSGILIRDSSNSFDVYNDTFGILNGQVKEMSEIYKLPLDNFDGAIRIFNPEKHELKNMTSKLIINPYQSGLMSFSSHVSMNDVSLN